MHKRLTSAGWGVAIAWLMAASGGCEDDGGGDAELNVVIEAEESITQGLQAGENVEDIQDGWQVSFDKYIMVVGDIEVFYATDEDIHEHDETLYAVDLATVPANGLSLWTLTGLRGGDWQFNYVISGGAEGAQRHQSVDEQTFSEIVANDLTYLIEGTLTASDGVSCPPAALATPGSAVAMGTNDGGDTCYANPSIDFVLGVPAETQFGPCEVDETPGFNIPEGGTQTVAISIHGDHIFFNGFPEGDEGGSMRLAQWLADSDLDVDGVVTQAELEAIAPADLAEIDDRYQLGGSPITPLATMWDYVQAQLKTQGHFQGEGECPIDGLVHQH